jgi:hypothetical protein
MMARKDTMKDANNTNPKVAHTPKAKTFDHRTWAALRTLSIGVGILVGVAIGLLVSLSGSVAETNWTDFTIAMACCGFSTTGIQKLIDGADRLLDIFSIHRARQKSNRV